MILLLTAALSVAQLLPPEARASIVKPWTMERMTDARRGNVLSYREIKNFVVEINRTKGKQPRRQIEVVSLPGLLWAYQDYRPTIFDLSIHRLNSGRETMDSPGRRGEPQERRRSARKDEFVDAELRWLGVPITCPGEIRGGEVDHRQGTTDVIITSQCSPYMEYIFKIDNQTGLPRSMEKWLVARVLEPQGALPRSCEERLIYLSWDDSPTWRMPTKLRRELYYFIGSWKKWSIAEYAVSSWLNLDLDPKFFEVELTFEINPDLWKDFVRKRE